MLPEDEVDSSFDITSTVHLIADLSQKGVLISVETDTIVSLLSAVRSQSNSLRAFSVSVLNVDVVEGGVCGFVDDCAGSFIIGGATCKTRAVSDSYDV